jgi:ornithine cyclodeaminase/alanine dehydrogenase
MPSSPAAASEVLFITAEDTLALLTWPEVIACLRAAYHYPDDADAIPPRAVARRKGAWLRAMPAMSPSGKFMGAKVFGGVRGRGVSYLIALWDQQTAVFAGILDARHITAYRTAATSAVAIDRLTPSRALRVAVLGSGSEATAHVRALAAVRSVSALTVYSPTPKSREDFAEKLGRELGVACRAADTPQAAVSGAELVIAAARSHDETPILHGAWLEPGMTVVSIGSTVAEQREVDSEVVRRAGLIVCDIPHEVAEETGDMIAAAAEGVSFGSKIVSLSDLVRGRHPGRRDAREIVMFKSVGSGLQDIAVSELCLELARARGLGSTMPATLSFKGKA